MPVDDQPHTLAEADEMLTRLQPAEDATLEVWGAFHRHAFEVFARTAQLDFVHRREARHRAGCELRRAREIEDLLDPPTDDEV